MDEKVDRLAYPENSKNEKQFDAKSLKKY